MNQVKAVVMGERWCWKFTLISLLQEIQVKNPILQQSELMLKMLFIADNQIAVGTLQVKSDFNLCGKISYEVWSYIIVTDSLNEMSRKLELLKQYDKKMGANVIAIANKQDLQDVLTPEQVQNELGIPTYGMVAVDNRNFGELYNIISTRILQAQNN
jgi:hypothetical protein